MFSPNYSVPFSLMESPVQIHGNTELAAELRVIIKEKCIESCELYEAQELIKNHCIDTYGADFYEKSADAVQYIVENEYCHVERRKHPAFDWNRYEEDMRKCVVY